MMDKQTDTFLCFLALAVVTSLPSSQAVYSGSVTYFYQHVPIPPPCQMQNSSGGLGKGGVLFYQAVVLSESLAEVSMTWALLQQTCKEKALKKQIHISYLHV